VGKPGEAFANKNKKNNIFIGEYGEAFWEAWGNLSDLLCYFTLFFFTLLYFIVGILKYGKFMFSVVGYST
jgi:hypothetical protein